MKIIVNDSQRALLYKGGHFVQLLDPGVHRRWFGQYKVQIMDANAPFHPQIGRVEQYVHHAGLSRQLEVVAVGDGQVALHFEDGRFAGALLPGVHAFWKGAVQHTFQLVDADGRKIAAVDPALLARMPNLVQRVEVLPGQRALMLKDGMVDDLLGEGTYFYWKQEVSGVKLTAQMVDMKLRQLSVQGQEVLTLDKVAVRVNFICRYRITDPVRAVTEISDHQEQLHVAAQLILRQYIGQHRLDELLENREQLGQFVFQGMKEREAQFFIEVADAGIRDIILPGEIREIMNTVLMAEKKAQANVITRREEVASTRSLLNTAKLMEENKTLMRLKEMEYLEKICDNVGSITVNGGSDLLGQLAALTKA